MDVDAPSLEVSLISLIHPLWNIQGKCRGGSIVGRRVGACGTVRDAGASLFLWEECGLRCCARCVL